MLGIAVWIWSDIVGEGGDGGPVSCFLQLVNESYITLIGGSELSKMGCGDCEIRFIDFTYIDQITNGELIAVEC